MNIMSVLTILMLSACTVTPQPSASPDWVDLSQRDKPEAIVTTPWTEIVISVPNFDDVPRLFQDIGGFETQARTGDSLVLGAPGSDGGFIRFEKTTMDAPQTRPFGSRSWDTGCYFSVMMRAKNIPSIIEDAKLLGWEPLTDMAYLEFGPSQLNIVVLVHKKTGVQVQLYERLTTPLPIAFPKFERLSRPFNMMQMVADRDVAYDFYQQGLGFDTFYYGPPTTSKIAQVSPIGIPTTLTTSVAYLAGITTPKAGLEWDRMEMIEVQMPGGSDLSQQCQPGHIGITEVRFDVDDLARVRQTLAVRQIETTSFETSTTVQTPDGATIRFVQK